MSKYYTPTPDEFHHGFEYETLQQDDDFNDQWIKTIFPDTYTCTRFVDGKPNLVEYFTDNLHYTRVKYLDKEDIESLGWWVNESNNEYTNFRIYDSNIMLLLFLRKNSKVEIVQALSNGKGRWYFEGTIKNKSELKRLCKQLNIPIKNGDNQRSG